MKKESTEKLAEEVTNEAKAFRSDIRGALFKEYKKRKVEWSRATAEEFVKGLKLWGDFKPRRVQALCTCVGKDETELCFEAGAVMA